MLDENQNSKIYTVSKLTEEIQTLLEGSFDFVWLEGEISNFRAPDSGHYYMVIKDEGAQIRSVMFRTQVRYLRFIPENGMKVIVQGRIGLYQPRGEYQIILDYLEPMGVGALSMAFEQLKSKLASQGLFDKDIKKPMPFLPQRVAVITSPTGAAIRDFLKIIRRRFANIEIIIIPVRVQGEKACGDMVKALDLINRELDVDVIVLTRGGGSLEDLWPFNQEDLALAIRRSPIPVVSAVGHEIDLTISDLVADLRASTPSAAAEILVMEKESLVSRLEETANRLLSRMRLVINNQTQKIEILTRALKDPKKRVFDAWMRLDEIQSRLAYLMDMTLRQALTRLRTGERSLVVQSPLRGVSLMRHELDFRGISLCRAMNKQLTDRYMSISLLEKSIKDLSPLSILNRGYSISRKLPEKIVLTAAAGVQKGDHLQVILAKGQLECRIEKVDPEQEF